MANRQARKVNELNENRMGSIVQSKLAPSVADLEASIGQICDSFDEDTSFLPDLRPSTKYTG